MSIGVWISLIAPLALFATGAAADESGFAWQDVGAQTFAAVCSACHQPNGQGVPHTFPPLAGHAPSLLSRPGGRDYLVRLVLYGVEGPITANGKPFSAAMPAWGETLTDAQLAGALDYVLNNWGNVTALPAGFQPFTPADIAAARTTKMTAAQVYALREGTDAGLPRPAVAASPPEFTQEQADRGHAIYRRNCQDCHGSNLNDGEFGGAPLNGQYFARHWGIGNVSALYGYMRAKMPPDRPGKLNPQTYADLTAFLLDKNGYQATHSELPPDTGAQEHMALKR
jgi:mono/diheme cytochrome c family protein